jgi:nucleoside-diphosphate-sugar epimerase
MGGLFQLIAGLMGSNATPVTDAERLRPGKSEVRRLCCDNTKLREATGFEPSTPLREGLAATIDWFQRPSDSATNILIGAHSPCLRIWRSFLLN